MKVETCRLPDVLIVTPPRFVDARGFFSETWNRERFSDVGINVDFVQDNHSQSTAIGTFRGFHFQRQPSAQAKLVRALRGAILDVVVDIRSDSATYGQSVSVELSAENGKQIFVPVGFAHALLTLRPDTEVMYKASAYYDPETEGGLFFDDPELQIDWPIPTNSFTVNERDRDWPVLADLEQVF